MRATRGNRYIAIWLFFVMLVVTSQVSADGAAVSKAAEQVNRTTAIVVKVEKAVKLKNFDPVAAKKLLDIAGKENAKVKALGKAYIKTYAALEKRLKAAEAKITARKAVIARLEKKRTETEKDAAESGTENGSAAGNPVQVTPIPSPTPTAAVSGKMDVHAFYSGNTNYSADVERWLKGLTSVSFAWLKLSGGNGVYTLDSRDSVHDFHYPDQYADALKFCDDNGISTQIAIFGEGNMAKAAIAQDATRKQLIDDIMNSLSVSLPTGGAHEFNGVVIDFEGFRQQDTKEYFNQFLRGLNDQLDTKGKKLFVAVNVLDYYPGYDYKEIIKLADKVILMAHDYAPKSNLSKAEINKYLNYSSSDPILALSPINKVQHALQDLTDCINDKSDLSKLLLQISFGTSQWQFDLDKPEDWSGLDSNSIGSVSSPTYSMIQARVENLDKLALNFTYGYISEQESPYLTYFNLGKKTFNIILYENASSVTAKINLAKEAGIGGISIWRLGTMPDYAGTQAKLDVWNTIMNAK